MATPTLEDMLSWPLPNYDNPREPLDPAVYGLNIPLAVLMTFFVGGRFYSRTFLVRGALGLDDWTMLVAFVFAMAQTIIHMVELKTGIGRHLYDVKLEWLPMVGKMTLVTQAMFGPTAALTKISICLSYLRLFPSKTNKRFNYTSMLLLAGWGISTTLVMCLQCRPLTDLWAVMKPDSEKNCVNIEAFFIATAAINSLTDLMVYLYPIHYLWQIKMATAKKVGLIICFCLGVIVCIAGIIRIWLLVRFFDSWDQTYNGALIYMLVAIEMDVGVICGCLPGIRPLMAKLFPNIIRNTDYSSTRGKGPSSSSYHVQSATRSFGRRGAYYQDIGDIHVTQDVELTVSSSKNGGANNARDQESEEWIFKE